MGFYKVCHECGEKYKKKQFYKDGVHYKEQLLNDLKDSPYLFACFDFESMFEFDWLCEIVMRSGTKNSLGWLRMCRFVIIM